MYHSRSFVVDELIPYSPSLPPPIPCLLHWKTRNKIWLLHNDGELFLKTREGGEKKKTQSKPSPKTGVKHVRSRGFR